jgi:hypothetical protein
VAEAEAIHAARLGAGGKIITGDDLHSQLARHAQDAADKRRSEWMARETAESAYDAAAVLKLHES